MPLSILVLSKNCECDSAAPLPQLPELGSTDDFLEFSGSLLRNVISGDVSVDAGLQRIRPHLETYSGLVPFFLEQLQLVEYSLEAESEEVARFNDFSRQLTPLPHVAADARERLEQEVLQTLGLSDKNQWDTRYVRTKTKWFFKLQKFNLLREEPEGFAELIDVLDLAEGAATSAIIDKIMEIAGKYDLDVYRIVETMLTACSHAPASLSRVLAEFCENVDFDVNTLMAMLGNTFKVAVQKIVKEPHRVRALCEVACHLVEQKLATWEDIVPNVPFSRSEAEEHWKQMFDRSVAENSIINTKSLAMKEKQNANESGSFEDVILFFEKNKNPRIELVTVMLQHGMYHDAVRLINDMPMLYATTFQPLAAELAKIIHYIINPLYTSVGLDPLKFYSTSSAFPIVLNDELPAQLVSFSELQEKLDPWLLLMGSNLIYDRWLFYKLLRISHDFVFRHESKINQDYSALSSDEKATFGTIMHLMEHCFLPALTRDFGSSALSEMVFSVLKMVPYNIRFTLYYKVKNDFYQFGHPVGVLAKSIAIANSKWFQKRVNKDNFKFCGRLIGKDLSTSAAVVCSYLTERIVSYDNFGTMVSDATRNASNFAVDVMLYTVLEFMSMSSFRKHDQVTILPGYRFIAVFAATFTKKQTVDVEPVIDYLVGMLKNGQTVDLLVLKELVHKLSGIELSEGVTEEQLEALAGGDVLKSEGAYFSPMRNTKRSSVKLKEALLRSNQALPLCLLISHSESNTLYREEDGKNLKLLGVFYDMCHDALVQYGTFLANNLTKKEYAENFPSLSEMIQTYKMPFETAIFLLRSVYWNEIMTKVDEFRSSRGISHGTLNAEDFRVVQDRFSAIFDDVITRVVDLIAPVMTQAPMEDISLRFYVLFWFLSLYDLYVPTSVYEQEIEKLQQVLAAQPIDGDSSEDIQTMQAVIKRKKEKERATALLGRLKEEMSVQRQHVQMLRNHLAEEKDKWFHMTKTTKSDVVSQFLQMCVLPRSTYSAVDALFSAHFISCLHELRTANFSTLLCYDRMLCDITTALMCCSENEASRYGRLLNAVLKSIMRWHRNKETFDAECHHHPGFVTKFRTPAVGTGSDTVDHIDFENFRHVCHKWHFKLTKSMVSSLETGSYVRIRNSLIVLDRVLPFYPIVSNFYLAIEKRVQQLMANEKDKRPDLYSLAYGYMGRMKAQKSQLVLEQNFHTKPAKKEEGKNDEEQKNGDLQTGESLQVAPAKAEGPVQPPVGLGAPQPLLAAKPVASSSAKENHVESDKKSVVKKSEASSKKSDSGSPKATPVTIRKSPVRMGPALPPKQSILNRTSDIESGDEFSEVPHTKTASIKDSNGPVSKRREKTSGSHPPKKSKADSKPAVNNRTGSITPSSSPSRLGNVPVVSELLTHEHVIPEPTGLNNNDPPSPSSIISDIVEKPSAKEPTNQSKSGSSRSRDKERHRGSGNQAESAKRSSRGAAGGSSDKRNGSTKKLPKDAKKSQTAGANSEKVKKERKPTLLLLPDALKASAQLEAEKIRKKSEIAPRNGNAGEKDRERKEPIMLFVDTKPTSKPSSSPEKRTSKQRSAENKARATEKASETNRTGGDLTRSISLVEKTKEKESARIASPEFLPIKPSSLPERGKERNAIEKKERVTENRASHPSSRETSKEREKSNEKHRMSGITETGVVRTSKRNREEDGTERERTHRRSKLH
ncbi:THO complex subunit 2-like [Paramacrobiotus metropolitanus]|uniref:THO complex subunit 2-like n=1 Tax=Paramacrobiotus metropolitanus TaxID=2943436 RepID=UPI002445BB69|nr:THO complex subunit 2-like [Paramacrobiotus metropolitanus]